MNQTRRESSVVTFDLYPDQLTRMAITARGWLWPPRSIVWAAAALLLLLAGLTAILFYRHADYERCGEIVVMVFALLAALIVFTACQRRILMSVKVGELAQTLARLQESESRFKELFESMTSCVAIYEAVGDGRDFVFKAVNKATERSERIHRKDIIGKSVFSVFQGVREYGLYDLLERVWRTGFPEYLPARYYQEDRRRGWKENSAYRLPTGEVVVIYNDVSKRKRAEEALRRSEETFSKIFKANPAAMMISRMDDGGIIDINAAFEILTGYSREELIGRSAKAVELWPDPVEREGTPPVPSGQELRLRTKTGQILTTVCSEQRIQLSTDTRLLSILVDITAARQAREEKRLLERQLYESQKMEAIGTLAGGVAHDFNNILGAIIGYAEMSTCQSDQNKLRRYNSQILAAADRAKELVMQILSFSRHNDHEQKPLDLKVITKETLKLLRSILPAGIELKCSIGAGPFLISGDATQMHQVLMNLCTNAAHAIGDQNGTLEVGLTLEDLSAAKARALNVEPRDYIRLSISDTGCGIDPAVIDRIFDPFFTTKKQGEGTGLGLSVVYGIVKNHHGHIRVQSQPGAGAAFDIYLPHLAECASATPVPPCRPAAGGHERILFVDDEEALVELAQKNLSELGYRVTPCSNGRVALSLFESDPNGFDLVITDMSMPGLSGSELSRRIGNIRPGLPIILCTGYSEYITPEKAAAMGIRCFLLKPLSRADLFAAVRKTLDEPPGSFAA